MDYPERLEYLKHLDIVEFLHLPTNWPHEEQSVPASLVHDTDLNIEGLSYDNIS